MGPTRGQGDLVMEEEVFELAKKRLAILESFIAIYFIQTQAEAKDTILCEQLKDGVMCYWLEPKGIR